jgi:hypothetical protein
VRSVISSARLTDGLVLRAVIRLSFLFCIGLALLLPGRADAGVMHFRGFPTRRVVIVQAPAPLTEPVAKLAPPLEPANTGEAANSASNELPPGLEVEKYTSQPSTKGPLIVVEKTETEQADAARKDRIKADRKRLNENAVNWQQERAAQGSAIAMRSLAFRYLNGDGVEKDEAKGNEWMRKAAEAGDSAAKKQIEKLKAAGKDSK